MIYTKNFTFDHSIFTVILNNTVLFKIDEKHYDKIISIIKRAFEMHGIEEFEKEESIINGKIEDKNVKIYISKVNNKIMVEQMVLLD